MKLVDDYIEYLMKETTPERPVWNLEKLLKGKKSDWDYIDGCMIYAFLECFKKTGDKKYLDFSYAYVGYRVEEDGTIKGFKEEAYNLDNINAGKNLLTLYELTKEERFKKAAGKIYNQILNQPRTLQNNFWHKLIYPNQIWLDGLYMVMPFYVKYANLFLADAAKEKAYEDVYNQFFNVEKLMKDDATGLYFHCIDTSKEMFWCDKETGLCENYWLRALGWFSMALLDCLILLTDKKSENYKHLLKIFKDFEAAVLKVQTESGMWYQLPAYPNREKNYLETSGSAIFSYSFRKGYNSGFLSKDYKEAGDRAFNDICNKYLSDNNGKLSLGGICLVAGLGGKEMRDGSYEYYMSEPIVKDDAKGIGPFILAYLEG